MKLRRISLALIFWLLIVMVLTVAQEPKDNILAQKVNGFHVINAPPSMVVERLSVKYGVPIGVESVPDSIGGKTRIAVDVQEGTVADVLNAVVSREPIYRWQKINGVINLFPKKTDSLLETVIENYEIRDVNKEDAVRTLKNSPEVRRELNRTSVKERTFVSPTWTPLDKLPRFTLVIKRATMRTILNEILKASRSNYWAFFRYGSQDEYFSLSVQ